MIHTFIIINYFNIRDKLISDNHHNDILNIIKIKRTSIKYQYYLFL